MKKLLLSFAAIVAIAGISQAQQVIDISGGVDISKNYSTSPSGGSTISSYTWSVDGGAVGFASSGTNTQNVTWSHTATPAIYHLRVVPVSDHSCNGVQQEITVQLVTSLPVTASWATATINECPFEATTNPTGGNVAATINLTGATPSGSGDWSVYYSVDGVAAAAPATVNGTAASFTISPNWTNTSTTTNVTHHVVITQITVNGTTYGPLAADLTVNIYPTPTINGISY